MWCWKLSHTSFTSVSSKAHVREGYGSNLAYRSGCTSKGIELLPAPAELAHAQHAQFTARLRKWGLSSGEVIVRTGDFCEHPDVKSWMSNADLVLVNNWAFSAQCKCFYLDSRYSDADFVFQLGSKRETIPVIPRFTRASKDCVSQAICPVRFQTEPENGEFSYDLQLS